MLFTGSYTALLTPFRNGEVDYDAYRKLVDFQIDNGTHGLVPVGTTGESPTLSHDEHKKVIEVCIDQANGRVPIISWAVLISPCCQALCILDSNLGAILAVTEMQPCPPAAR